MRPHIKRSFKITQACTNGKATLKMCATKIKSNIQCINLYKYETNVDNIHMKLPVI